jgi:hypothetical protein
MAILVHEGRRRELLDAKFAATATESGVTVGKKD